MNGLCKACSGVSRDWGSTRSSPDKSDTNSPLSRCSIEDSTGVELHTGTRASSDKELKMNFLVSLDVTKVSLSMSCGD